MEKDLKRKGYSKKGPLEDSIEGFCTINTWKLIVTNVYGFDEQVSIIS